MNPQFARPKTFLSVLLFSLSLILTSTTHAGTNPKGQPFQQLQNEINALQQQLNNIQQNTPIEVSVDCSSESIGEILDQYRYSAVPLVIDIVGTCNEAVTINRSNVTLNGNGTAQINGTGDRTTVLITNGASNVTIKSLSITGGFFGLNCDENSNVRAEELNITGVTNGVGALNGGNCLLADTSVSNTLFGVGASNGGSLRLLGDKITNNTFGIVVNAETDVYVSSMDTSTDLTTSIPEIKDNLVGAYVMGGTLSIDSDALIDNNNTGVALLTGGRLSIGPNLHSIKILNNSTGIELSNMGKLWVSFLPGHVDINHNTIGINCKVKPGAVFDLQNTNSIDFTANGTDISSSCP